LFRRFEMGAGTRTFGKAVEAPAALEMIQTAILVCLVFHDEFLDGLLFKRTDGAGFHAGKVAFVRAADRFRVHQVRIFEGRFRNNRYETLPRAVLGGQEQIAPAEGPQAGGKRRVFMGKIPQISAPLIEFFIKPVSNQGMRRGNRQAGIPLCFEGHGHFQGHM